MSFKKKRGKYYCSSWEDFRDEAVILCIESTNKHMFKGVVVVAGNNAPLGYYSEGLNANYYNTEATVVCEVYLPHPFTNQA